jgi:hypothetical protein
VRGADLAFAAETSEDDRVPWSDWILFDLPPGPGGRRGGVVGADGEILRAFVALLILSPDLESQASSVGSLGWLTGRLGSAISTLAEVSQDAVLLERVFGGLDDIEQRARIVRELLGRSARLQAEAEAQALLSSDLSPEKVAGFEAQAREAWLANRLAPTLFRQARSHEAATGEPAGGHLGGWTEVKAWSPRSLFVAEREVFGGDSIAYQMGFRLADEEMRALLTKLMDAEAFAQDIRGILEGMAREGYEPSAIFVSNEFQFVPGVQFDDDTSASSPPESVPERAARAFFLGRIGRIPVFRSLHVPEGRACVADLAAFAEWHQWTVGQGGEELLLETEEFDEVQALDLAREQPDLFRSPERQSTEDRARQIRSRVRLCLRERFEIRVKDAAAARWVNLTGRDHHE